MAVHIEAGVEKHGIVYGSYSYTVRSGRAAQSDTIMWAVACDTSRRRSRQPGARPLTSPRLILKYNYVSCAKYSKSTRHKSTNHVCTRGMLSYSPRFSRVVRSTDVCQYHPEKIASGPPQASSTPRIASWGSTLAAYLTSMAAATSPLGAATAKLLFVPR